MVDIVSNPPHRRADDPRIAKVQEQVEWLTGRHAELKTRLDENTALTGEVKRDTAGLVEAWTAIAGGMKVLGWLGRVAKWFGVIAGAIAASGGAWYALTHWGQGPVDAPKLLP